VVKNLAEKTKKGKKGNQPNYRLPQIRIREELKLFLLWLAIKLEVNISEYIRELIKSGEEWREFKKLLENEPEKLEWLRDHLPKGKR